MRFRARVALLWALAVLALVVTVHLGRKESGRRNKRSVDGDDAANDDVTALMMEQLPSLLSPQRAVSTCKLARQVQDARKGKGAGHAVTLTFVGDVSFARDIGRQLDEAAAAEDGADGCASVFRHVHPLFQASDVVLANLESPGVANATTSSDPQQRKRISLGAQLQHLRCLKTAGITTVSLANNHVLDFGEASFRETLAALDELSIGVVGATAGASHIGSTDPRKGLAVQTIKGVKLGFLAFCQVKACRAARSHANVGPRLLTSLSDVLDAIEQARTQVDVVVVVVHWGREYYTRVSQLQRHQAEEMTKAGAHIIVGHHQHVLQDHAIGSNSAVLYGLGNFVFDSHVCRDPHTYAINFTASPACMSLPPPLRPLTLTDVMHSRIYRVEVNRYGVISASYLPVRTVHFPQRQSRPLFQPRPALPKGHAAGGGGGGDWTYQPSGIEASFVHVCAPGDPHCLQCQ
ncbi:hypothetical protein PTSG_02411 [Salpingoeca rosetta]|uniref:Capsule synthesis protein CapA domain-containing protein n=1 Tax=Salpingoeca rosetta (strain ATCC 50818 / BSB-021) TaxID=946362 RepID=F2U246_SALR5|nr:uncharacterized protein PTSG_02411 [Salpingoeca rosetta]EGD81698.1 hypothetical protein PTSG_02411 [Salpingoeca rosetta]|eukprot:XP_004996902.1 hypothetical protein PTSG_02411 [Salpingoeca rosetta]